MDEKIQLEGALRGRIAWVSASTHSGEETQLLNVHEILSAKLHSTTNKEKLLTIIIPRHTSRAKAILAECQAAFPHLTIDLRSKISLPSMSTDVFIVDTMVSSFLKLISCVLL
jgi:3-deoxy-D-manno-octulosonic-acid transferase